MPLDISEYQALARDDLGNVIPTGAEPSRIVQQVAAGVASTQSQPFGDTTRFVRLHTDTPIRFAVGVDPVASAASPRMSGGATGTWVCAPATALRSSPQPERHDHDGFHNSQQRAAA